VCAWGWGGGVVWGLVVVGVGCVWCCGFWVGGGCCVRCVVFFGVWGWFFVGFFLFLAFIVLFLIGDWGGLGGGGFFCWGKGRWGGWVYLCGSRGGGGGEGGGGGGGREEGGREGRGGVGKRKVRKGGWEKNKRGGRGSGKKGGKSEGVVRGWQSLAEGQGAGRGVGIKCSGKANGVGGGNSTRYDVVRGGEDKARGREGEVERSVGVLEGRDG